MSLGHLSQLINKQIYSDDFDKSSYRTELSRRYKQRVGGPNSMADQPINEDEEEIENDYLSDCSSNSSQFSLQRRYLSLDLSKLIDRLEPMDDSSAVHSKYYGNVNETIEEEISDHDDEVDKQSRLSHSSKSSNSSRVKKRVGDSYLSFMSIISDKIRRARSHICQLESETIAEELEEYDYQTAMQPAMIDENMHNFKVPARLRADSDGQLHKTPMKTDLGNDSGDHGSTNADLAVQDSNLMGNGNHFNQLTSTMGHMAAYAENRRSFGGASQGAILSSGEEEKTPKSSSTLSSSNPRGATVNKSDRSIGNYLFSSGQFNSMTKGRSTHFGSSRSSHGGHRHAKTSHNSKRSTHSRNLSVSSLPTIREERNKRATKAAIECRYFHHVIDLTNS